MPFEITMTGRKLIPRGHGGAQYDFMKQVVVTHRVAADLEAVRGDLADLVTDHRRAANALISEWREFYRLVEKWDGSKTLVLPLTNETTIVSSRVSEGNLRRRVQSTHPQEKVVEKSLAWVVAAYNTDQKEDA